MLILLLFGMTCALIVFGIENFIFHFIHSKRTAVPLPLKRTKLIPKGKAPPKKNVGLVLPKKNTLLKNAMIAK